MPEPDPEPPTTVAIVTLGCGRNEVDSQNAAGMLAAAGYRVVADPEQADAVVVNTCAFVEAAKRESIETVLDATALKDQGRARTVLVTGCLAERYTEELRVELPEADAIVPFRDYGKLPSLLGGSPIPLAAGPLPMLVPAGRRALPMVFPTPAGAAFPARAPAPGPVALVKLAEGCDRDCSFCAIPSFRGRFRSRRPTEILDEVTWLAGQGVSEVCLVAENSTSYGKDLGGREALVHLLRDLAGIDGLRRVRLNYLQPDELTAGPARGDGRQPGGVQLLRPLAAARQRARAAEDAPRRLGRRLPRPGGPDPRPRPGRRLPLQLHPRVPGRAQGRRARAGGVPGGGPAGLGRVLRLVARGRHHRPRPGRPRPGGHRQGPGRARPGSCKTACWPRPSRPGSAAGSRCWSSGSRTAPPRAAASGRPPTPTALVRVEGAPRPLRAGDYLPVVVTAAEGPELLARPAG